MNTINIVPVKYGDDSPDTYIIKGRNSFGDPFMLAKDGQWHRTDTNSITYLIKEFKTKTEAEFVRRSLQRALDRARKVSQDYGVTNWVRLIT
jgi:hypothetical protein